MPEDRERELLQQIAEQKARLAAAQVEIAFLRQKLDALARQLFGKKSEQLDPAQLQLLFQELDTPGPALGKGSGPQSLEADSARPEQKAAASRRKRRPRLPEHLPVIEEVIEPPQVQVAPEQWRRIGEEVTERLDYEPDQSADQGDHPRRLGSRPAHGSERRCIDLRGQHLSHL